MLRSAGLCEAVADTGGTALRWGYLRTLQHPVQVEYFVRQLCRGSGTRNRVHPAAQEPVELRAHSSGQHAHSHPTGAVLAESEVAENHKQLSWTPLQRMYPQSGRQSAWRTAQRTNGARAPCKARCCLQHPQREATSMKTVRISYLSSIAAHLRAMLMYAGRLGCLVLCCQIQRSHYRSRLHVAAGTDSSAF